MDDLIGQNPRDYLIVLREQNLRIERERKNNKSGSKSRNQISKDIKAVFAPVFKG